VDTLSIDLRKTGITAVGDVPWGTHFCHFFETKEDLLDILLPYFRTGLENNEFCVWVVSDPLGEEEARNALRQAVPEADRYLATGHIEIVTHSIFPSSRQPTSPTGQIEIVSHTEWYLKGGAFVAERVIDGWNEKLAQALAKGYAGLRANGNEAWLTDENRKDFIQYEKKLDEKLADQRMIVLCSYPLSSSSAAQVFDVVNTHQLAVIRRRGNWEVIETPEPIQAKAEIKRLDKELQRVLDRRSEPPAIVRYGFAVLSIIAAVIILWLMDTDLQAAAYVSVCLCGVILSSWFGGIRPGLLAIVLSIVIFAYILPPPHSLAVEITYLPRLLLFALLAFFVASLTADQRSKAASLRRARDVLDGTVHQLKQTNEALRRENAERKRAEEALRQSEDRLRLVIDTIPVMAWSLQPDGIVDFLNQRWMDYAGLSLEEYVADPMGPIHPEDIPRVTERWLVQMAVGEGYDDEMRLRRADGEYRWFMVRTAPLRDEQGTIIKWYGVSTDIEDRKRAEDRLKATTKQLRALSASLQFAREEEGTRIAREIHDELGSALTSLKWDLESFDKVISESIDQSSPLRELSEKLAAMVRLSETTINAVRRISSELRPSVLDDLGLVPAIEWQARQFQARTGIICHCECSVETFDLNQDQSTAVFRILQEALTNVLRHAEATRVKIAMKEEAGEFVLTVSDNGRGITDDDKSRLQSLGLLGMRERAHLIGGEIDITGVAGQGTVVTVRVPKL
jgi:PAS domain S-box-containing protein